MASVALPQAQLDALNEALAAEVRSTRDVVVAAQNLGATIIAAEGNSWLCQFAEGRARLWRATAQDERGLLHELDGFDGAVDGFGHRHLCLNCQDVIEDVVLACAAPGDHARELCADCLAAGVRPKDGDSDVLLSLKAVG
jgi:hypothetical protein